MRFTICKNQLQVMRSNNLLSLLLLSLILWSCSKPESNTAKDVPEITSEAIPEKHAEPASKPRVRESQSVFEEREFALDAIPNELHYDGNAKDGAHWKDNLGEHWLLISEKKAGASFDPGHVSNLYAACWRNTENGWQQQWQIKDFNQKDWESRSYMDGTIKLSDLDKDGVAESLFIYQLGQDGLDPTDFKLMLHVNNVKYAIRGTLASEESDIGEVDAMKPDKAFDEIDPMFKKYAIEEWNGMAKKWNASLR